MPDILELEKKLDQELPPELRSSTLLDLCEQYRIRDLPRALSYARQAMELTDYLPHTLYRAHLELGRCYTESGDFVMALEHLEQADQHCEETDTPPLKLMAVQHARAIIYDLMSDFSRALELFSDNLKHLERSTHKQKYADSLNSIAVVHGRAKNFPAAIKFFIEAQQIYKDLNQLTRFNVIYINIGLTYRELGDLKQARTHLENALHFLRSEDLDTFRAIALLNLAQITIDTQDFTYAISLAHEALELSTRQGLKYQEILARRDLGAILIELGQLKEAESYLKEALLVLAFTPNALRETEVREHLAKIYHGQSLFEQAYAELERIRELEKQNFNAEYQDKIQTLQVRFDVEKAHQDAEIERLKTVELENLLQEKSRLVEQLEQLSITDGLTGLYNRRYLDSEARRVYGEARAGELCISLADIDFFKRVNDTFGHATGDEVLKQIAVLYRENTRAGDFVARYGGEEFALVMPYTRVNEALEVCERVRSAVEHYEWSTIHPQLKVTLSLGLCATLELGSHEKMLQDADHWLYQAKHEGKNRVRYDFSGLQTLEAGVHVHPLTAQETQ